MTDAREELERLVAGAMRRSFFDHDGGEKRWAERASEVLDAILDSLADNELLRKDGSKVVAHSVGWRLGTHGLHESDSHRGCTGLACDRVYTLTNKEGSE